jgi:hypothetical protein
MIVTAFNPGSKMLGLKFQPVPRMDGFLIFSNLKCIHVCMVAAAFEQFKVHSTDQHTWNWILAQGIH